jgi:predicted amidophosphoribosyltransferase
MATFALDLILPRRCVSCRAVGTHLCTSCRGAMRRLGAPLCERCGAPTAWPVARCTECSGRRLAFVRARAAVAYDGVVRLVVAAWKERGLRGLASVAAAVVVEVVQRPAGAVLAFVPPDGERSRERGHHPPARLAAELAQEWDLPVERLLARTRRLRRQRGLGVAARRRNVRGAFAAVGRSPPFVALVDDVYTTGATVNAAASALRAAGARRVAVVTFARAVR